MKVKVWEWQEEFELDLPETATVERLRREVAVHCNRQEEEVILMLQGRALVDLDLTLQEEGVLDCDRISLVIRQGRDSAVQPAAQAAIPPIPARPPVPLEPSPATQFPATAPKTFGYGAKSGGALPFPPSVIPPAQQNAEKAIPAPLEASTSAKFNPVPAKSANFGFTGGKLGASKPKVPKTEEAASELKPAAPQSEVPPATKPVGYKPIPVAAANTGYKPVAAAPTGTSAPPIGLKAAPTGTFAPPIGLKAAPTPTRQFSSPEAVSRLTELGYSRAEAETALEKAQGDMELAAGYLSGDSEPEGDEKVQAYLEQLRTMMRSDPAAFDMLLKSTPQLAAMDAQVPGGLKQFLQSGASLGGRSPGPADNAPLTAADQSNIEQLVNLGFSAEQAKEAYLGCRRNVEMAAEVLLSGG